MVRRLCGVLNASRGVRRSILERSTPLPSPGPVVSQPLLQAHGEGRWTWDGSVGTDEGSRVVTSEGSRESTLKGRDFGKLLGVHTRLRRPGLP